MENLSRLTIALQVTFMIRQTNYFFVLCQKCACESCLPFFKTILQNFCEMTYSILQNHLYKKKKFFHLILGNVKKTQFVELWKMSVVFNLCHKLKNILHTFRIWTILQKTKIKFLDLAGSYVTSSCTPRYSGCKVTSGSVLRLVAWETYQTCICAKSRTHNLSVYAGLRPYHVQSLRWRCRTKKSEVLSEKPKKRYYYQFPLMSWKTQISIKF